MIDRDRSALNCNQFANNKNNVTFLNFNITSFRFRFKYLSAEQSSKFTSMFQTAYLLL